MKYTVVFLLFLVIAPHLHAQSANDKRGFQGTITSATRQVINHDGESAMKNEQEVETSIQFTGRTIIIGNETYDIMKREFDGKSKTVFTCTKRRGTFEVSYIPNQSISVVDQSNPSMETQFVSLSEK